MKWALPRRRKEGLRDCFGRSIPADFKISFGRDLRLAVWHLERTARDTARQRRRTRPAEERPDRERD
jgi:hypothetical protein